MVVKPAPSYLRCIFLTKWFFLSPWSIPLNVGWEVCRVDFSLRKWETSCLKPIFCYKRHSATFFGKLASHGGGRKKIHQSLKMPPPHWRHPFPTKTAMPFLQPQLHRWGRSTRPHQERLSGVKAPRKHEV